MELKSHIHIMNECVPWKFASDVKNPVLQVLQIHYTGICHKFQGRTGTSHYRTNESFVEGQFNASASPITFEQGI
jgi:hypothetical protein